MALQFTNGGTVLDRGDVFGLAFEQSEFCGALLASITKGRKLLMVFGESGLVFEKVMEPGVPLHAHLDDGNYTLAVFDEVPSDNASVALVADGDTVTLVVAEEVTFANEGGLAEMVITHPEEDFLDEVDAELLSNEFELDGIEDQIPDANTGDNTDVNTGTEEQAS
jgi:hypothetical protein